MEMLEEGRPYSFAHVSVQKIREMNKKGSTSKKSVYLPPILYNCVNEYGEKIESTLSRISLF
jgi:hypothetical protein